MAHELAHDLPRSPNRKVWVKSRLDVEWVERFRGKDVRIPPKGRILMNTLEADRFLGQPAPPGVKNPRGEWIRPSKALYREELTEEELMEIDGKNFNDLTKDLKKMEKKARTMCSLCGKQMLTDRGLKAHYSRIHPGEEPISED